MHAHPSEDNLIKASQDSAEEAERGPRMSELDQGLKLIAVAFTAISGLMFLLTQAEEWLSTSGVAGRVGADRRRPVRRLRFSRLHDADTTKRSTPMFALSA